MARPTKEGLDYFPLDCQLDDKFELLEAEYGIEGFGVVVKLLQKIYGQNGYYIEWTNEVALLFAKRIGVGGSVVSEIVGAALRRGIFDKGMYERYHILTSRGIQKRYLEATSRRKNPKIENAYLLLKCTHNEENANIKRINVNNNYQNADNNKQSKVKESKGKESRVKESKERKELYPPTLEEVKNYCKQINAKFNPEHFYHYYQTKNWIVNGYSILSYWKEKVRNWNENEKERGSSKKTGFNNFPSQDYNIDELEKQLLKNSIMTGSN